MAREWLWRSATLSGRRKRRTMGRCANVDRMQGTPAKMLDDDRPGCSAARAAEGRVAEEECAVSQLKSLTSRRQQKAKETGSAVGAGMFGLAQV
jgi:hypothetical protein